MLTILLCLLFSEIKPIKVVVSNNRESKMMIQDFEIKWQERKQSGMMKRLDEIQAKVKPRIEFIDITKIDSKILKYSHFDKYPVILYGEYGVEPECLPENSYYTRSFPLLSMEAYINKIEFDYQKYAKQCRDAEAIASHKYEAWLLDNRPEEVNDFIQFFYTEEFYDHPTWADFHKKFDHIKGIPVIRPDYPERPRIWYPWEKEYLLYISYDKYERIIE